MRKNRIQLRNVQNVAASKTALITIPIGQRFHYIVLEHGYTAGTNTVAAAASNITEIRVKVNGIVMRTFSGTQLRDINLLNGTTYDCLGVPNTAPGVSFPIFFAEPWRKSPGDQDGTAWPTEGWDSFQIEVDLGAASTPTLVATAVTDAFVPNIPVRDRLITKVIRQQIGANGTSFDVSSLAKRDYLQQISIYPDSGASLEPSKVTLRLNSQILHELEDSANQALLTNHGMTPAASGRTANIYDLVLDHDDLLGSAVLLNGARDLTLTIEAASAMSGTTTMLIQRFGPVS